MKKSWRLFTMLFVLSILGTWVSASFLQLIEQHYRLAEGKEEATISNHAVQHQDNQTFDLWFVLEESDRYLRTDIVEMLDKGERAQNLNAYLQDGRNLLQQLNWQDTLLKMQYQQAESALQSCESQLKTSNSEYSEALKTFDEQWFLRAIKEAKQARTCIGEQYVSVSSNRDLLRAVERYQQLISRRLAYLEENKNLIIQHYEILRPQLLSRLQAITSVLNIRD